jgi:hypothetical protein
VKTPQRPNPILDPLAYQQWLDAIIPLQEGAALRNVSVDTLKRAAAKGKVKLYRRSERLLGMRRRDALLIPP